MSRGGRRVRGAGRGWRGGGGEGCVEGEGRIWGLAWPNLLLLLLQLLRAAALAVQTGYALTKMNKTNFFAFQTLVTIAAKSITSSCTMAGTQRGLDFVCHSDSQLLELDFKMSCYYHLFKDDKKKTKHITRIIWTRPDWWKWMLIFILHRCQYKSEFFRKKKCTVDWSWCKCREKCQIRNKS